MISSSPRFSGLLLSILLSHAAMPCAAAAQVPDSVSTKANYAVSLGLAYFNAPGMSVDPDAALFHAYIRDRFGLPKIDSAQQALARIRADRADPLYKFLRMVEPRRCELDFLDPGGPDDLAIAGLWYDELEDPALLQERIEEAMLDDPYTVTHALWALSMAKHCFQAELDTALERRLVALNMEIMASHRPLWNDVAIEALAMAQYHDPSYVPPAEYILELMALQNPDGSWNWTANDPSSGSQHTTILSLWALLQYKPLGWPVRSRDMAVREAPAPPLE